MGATRLDRGIDFLEIDRDGCMRMLAAASGGVGRIGLGVSPPTIRPVNYAFDDQTQSVVFRSALGSKLREGLSSGTATFTGKNLYREGTGAPVLFGNGRQVASAVDGSLIASSGRNDFVLACNENDPAAFAPICAALDG